MIIMELGKGIGYINSSNKKDNRRRRLKEVKEVMKINTNDTPLSSEKSGSGDQSK
ncbi:Variable outer membrane protein (plasmid) [Borrelia crocidurae DOU]|uniref:Variable outer membrane protein n=1 Tax=Borrelia crocidurae DOU TaxID=1293575 RepID=W5SKW3_9SPIR|nr:Variable outer membrane protein [Borrelia crocidurae DOU]